jgi:hypothetical protein
MSQDEADSILVSRLVGQYRIQEQKRIAERRAREAAEQLEAMVIEKEATQQNFDTLQARSLEIRANMSRLQVHAQDLTSTMSQIFNEERNVTNTGHLARNGYIWPTQPSPQAFYSIYAIAVPLAHWPPDGANAPKIGIAFQAANLFIHMDRADQYSKALGGDDKMRDIGQTLQSSRDLVRNFLDGEGSNEEKQKFLNGLWEVAKFKVLKAMRPNSSSIPPFFVSFLVDEAAAKIQKQRERERARE